MTYKIQGLSGVPILIELLITRNCSFNCRHCMYDCGSHESNEYMSDEILAKVKRQVDFLKELEMKVGINLVGGEPTMNFDKFSHILDEVRTWNTPTQITTNGWWLASPKNIERFFSIVSKYASPNGMSRLSHSYDADVFCIRISDDPFHEEKRKVKDINYALSKILSNKELSQKYNIPFPNPQDPWIWKQVYDERYYIAPNGRGKNVTNVDEWISKFGVNGNFCVKNFNGAENIHYEPDGSISDTCSLGSKYDFGTVDDNIIFILEIIWQYKKERWQNKHIRPFNCKNCREMVSEWKENNLETWREYYSPMNTFNIEEFVSYIA